MVAKLSPAVVDTHDRRKEKLVVIMGATGTGKSRLSVDLARSFPAEIVNSDKMQVYKGLDIDTNKIRDDEQCGVPHHLMNCVESSDVFSVDDYVRLASAVISGISDQELVPILVGGSNSYIKALVSSNDANIAARFRYDCCFIWIDVSLNVLDDFVSRRVDEMIDAGLVEDLSDFYDPNERTYQGLRQAIGVPEFADYFHHYPPDSSSSSDSSSWSSSSEDDWEPEEGCKRQEIFQKAVEDMKTNTIKLAKKQRARIHELLRDYGWNIHRIDATPAFEAAPSVAGHVWDMKVLSPAIEIVKKFLSPVKDKVKMVISSKEGEVPRQIQHGILVYLLFMKSFSNWVVCFSASETVRIVQFPVGNPGMVVWKLFLILSCNFGELHTMLRNVFLVLSFCCNVDTSIIFPASFQKALSSTATASYCIVSSTGILSLTSPERAKAGQINISYPIPRKFWRADGECISKLCESVVDSGQS